MENEFIKKVRNSTIIVVGAQIVVLVFSMVKNLIIPYIFKNVEMYAKWQIYVFYLSYILIFSCGFNDGLYLKYTGNVKKAFNNNMVKNSVKMQMLFVSFISIVLLALIAIIPNFDKKIIYELILLNLLPLTIIDIFQRIFQADFEMKKYSLFVTIDKIIFIVLIGVLCFLPNINEYYVISIDLAIKIGLSLYLMIKYKKYWMGKIENLKTTFKEWMNSCKSGIFILISSYLLILLTGIGRVFVEFFGNLSDYAMYSFSISIAGIITALINAVGTVLFPTLKAIKTDRYNYIVEKLNRILIILTPAIILCYFPMEIFVRTFLPKYTASLIYLVYILCMVIVKGFTSLIYIPIIKAVRMEKKLFKNNILSLLIYLFVFIPIYIFTKNVLTIAIGALVVSYIELLMDEEIIRKVCNIEKNYYSIYLGLIILTFIVLKYFSLNITCAICEVIILLFMIFKYNKDIFYLLHKIIKA